MKIDDLRILYDYNFWANQRILKAAEKLSDEQFQTIAQNGDGNLRRLLVHTMEAEYAWRTLCQNQNMDAFEKLNEADFPTVHDLARRWQKEEAAMRVYLASLSDTDLNGTITYPTDDGGQRTRVLWHCLAHVINHGTQHRSESAVILTKAGTSPGEMDMVLFLNSYSENPYADS